MTYNGWSNYPTWCVNLWLDNDQYTQRDSHNVVLRAYRNGISEARRIFPERDDEGNAAFARSVAADSLKEYVEEMLNDERADLGSDLQSWALGEVDWREIVTSWLEDDLAADEDDDEDDDGEEDA